MAVATGGKGHKPEAVWTKRKVMLVSVFAMLLGLMCDRVWFQSAHFQLGCDREESIRTKTAPASPILFVHFHKSGGTSVCKTMKEQQVSMTDMMGNPRDENGLNCNTELSGPRNKPAMYHTVQNCRMLETYTMDQNGIPFERDNFLAVEVPFSDTMPCPGFRSFALMRDPVQRLLSHMNVNSYTEALVLQWIETREISSSYRLSRGERMEARLSRGERMGAKSLHYLKGYAIVNSMVIRQLLGRERYIDPRPVDENDLHMAKALVDSFDAFVPMEYLQHSAVLKLLERTIPEYYQGLVGDPLVANKSKRGKDFSEHFIEVITKENVYDIMLYQYMMDKLGIKQ